MNVEIAADGRLTFAPPRSRAGDSMILHAEMDLAIALSACPAPTCNGSDAIGPLAFEVLQENRLVDRASGSDLAQFTSGSAIGLRTLSAVPAAATMIAEIANHCSRLKCSPSKATPATAAIAGSRLSKVPKLRVGRRVSATISSEYGRAELSTATPSANGSSAGLNSALPACTTPTGIATSAAIEVPQVTASPPCALPARWPSTM